MKDTATAAQLESEEKKKVITVQSVEGENGEVPHSEDEKKEMQKVSLELE